MNTATNLKQIGLEIMSYEHRGEIRYSLTGFPSSKIINHCYDSAYDFEETVKNNIDCLGIDFDSESCCFYAYAGSKSRLIQLLSDIVNHFEKNSK